MPARPPMAQAWRSARGLTLIEAVIALAVLAVLASVALPSFVQQLHRQRLKATAETLAGDLAEARFEAARRGLPLHLALQPGTDWCWALATTPGCGCRVAQACQLKTVLAGDHRGVQLVAGGDAAFDATGTTAGAASALLRTPHGEQLRVSLSALGRARVCSPDGRMAGYARC